MKKTLSVILTFLVLHVFAAAHPFYVSVTQIDLKDGSLQITVKVFADDLQEALLSNGAPELYLGETKEVKNSNEYLHQYLRDHLTLTINNEGKNYRFLGHEMEDGAVWMYMEITNTNHINTLEVSNTILINQFANQTNLIHTDIHGQQKSLILDKETKNETLTF